MNAQTTRPRLIDTLSGQQQLLVRAILDPRLRHVVASGPKRSGKSYPATAAWLDYIRLMWPTERHDFGLVAPSAQRVAAVKLELRAFCFAIGWAWRQRQEYVEFGPHRLYSWVSKHPLSHEQITGHTWAGCLVDEATRVQEACIRELSIRCSVDHSKIVYSTNPKNSLHPFKLHVMDPIDTGAVPGYVSYHRITDNPVLSPEVIQAIADTLKHDPVAYARDFEGKWMDYGGGVYPSVGQWVAKPPSLDAEVPFRCHVTVDPAEATVTHALLIGEYSGGRHWVLEEWRHDGRTDGIKEYPDQVREIVDWATGMAPCPIVRWRSDPADTPFRTAMAHYGEAEGATGSFATFPKPAEAESITAVKMAGNGKMLRISPSCGQLIREMSQLQWNEKYLMERGEEKPTAGNDHGADALRYHVWDTDLWRQAAWIN